MDSSVGQSTRKIARLIQQDAVGDEEWDHFIQEFSVLHKDFIDRLSFQFGNFSKNELRLVSFMKMNLSTKEIANTLRVSPDGVKKARYRLRKKMGLASDIDLQDYLLSY